MNNYQKTTLIALVFGSIYGCSSVERAGNGFSMEKAKSVSVVEVNLGSSIAESRSINHHAINPSAALKASKEKLVWLFTSTGRSALHPSDVDAILSKINSSKLVAFFSFNDTQPIPGFNYEKSDLAELIKAKEVIVVGHTDSLGSDVYNMKLGERRAESIKSWLIEKGVDPLKITIVSMGEKEPAASNKTSLERAKNRRVEVYARS